MMSAFYRSINSALRTRLLVLLASTVWLVGCTGISVHTDYDTARNFESLKTYAWLDAPTKLVVDPLVDNDLMDERIRRSVEANLAAMGYQQATGDNGADFFVTYHINAETQYSIDSFYGHYGYYPCWHCFGPRYGGRTTTVRAYQYGNFMIDLIEPASSKLMWRGVAGRRLSSGTPMERDAYVNKIVSSILAKFPPGRDAAE